jgi:flagellar biosynthesis/type III secretory pathway chaperone
LLLASLEAEQSALVKNDIVSLGEAVETQKALTRRAGLQERDRVKIVRQIAGLLQEDANRLTLKRLIDLIDPPLSLRLRDQREELLGLQDHLRKANRQNSLLIKQSMKYVDKCLQIISGCGPNGNIYARSGKSEKARTNTPVLLGMVNQVV